MPIYTLLYFLEVLVYYLLHVPLFYTFALNIISEKAEVSEASAKPNKRVKELKVLEQKTAQNLGEQLFIHNSHPKI